jgi:hypothetical protein
VVLVSQDGVDHEEGLISVADAATLAESGFTFVQIPGNVQLASGAIVLQTHDHQL